MTPALPPLPCLAVPLALLRCPEISDAALRTWMLLYALAGSSGGAPPLPRRDLARLIGKCESILNLHLARLRQAGVLDWQAVGSGQIRLIFPAQFQAPPAGCAAPSQPGCEISESNHLPFSENSQKTAEKSESQRPTPAISEKPEPRLSFNYDLKSLIPQEESGEAPLRKIKNRPAAIPAPPRPAPPAAGPLEAYRQIVGRQPNPAQRQLIQRRVCDMPRWQASLEHWLAHGWNPLNIPGMLELYERGGPSACQRCGQPNRPAQKPNPIQELIEKYADPRDA